VSLLIDGYNLLHATGIFGRGQASSSLERSRTALLNVLAASIPPDELDQATIVFDANQAPPGLPRRVDHGGLTVCYASEYEDADSMIEELIARHHTPRRLLVVSSDHRLQRAARRRRAQAIDSDVWYTELIRQRAARAIGPGKEPPKPAVPLSPTETEYWLKQFTDKESGQSAGDAKRAGTDALGENDAIEGNDALEENLDELSGFDNPFPPGYGEDLLEE